MRIYPGTTVDYEFATLGGLGYTGTLNDRQFAALRAEGLTGSLPDMFKQFDGTLGGGFVPPVAMSLTNSGAEAGSATGWTAVEGASLFESTALVYLTDPGFPGPHSGAKYFYASTNLDAKMYQDVDVSSYAAAIDAGNVSAILTFWFSTFDGFSDLASVYLEARSASDTVLASAGYVDVAGRDYTVWLQDSLGTVLPANTRKLRVQIQGRREVGTSNDVFFDDLSLVLYAATAALPPRFDSSISRGDRTATITVSATNIATGGGTLSGLIDGSQANNYYWTATVGNGTGWLKFDFGAGASWIVDEFVWRQDDVTPHGTWRMEGSNDDSTWTQVGSDFTLSPGLNTPGNPSSAAYRYLRLRHMSGTRSNSSWLREIQFRAKTP